MEIYNGNVQHGAHLHPLTNVPTKCQPSTPYGIQKITQTRF